MSDNEDDKATVVLDINALKDELNKKKSGPDDDAVEELEFSAHEEDVSTSEKEIILFDLNESFFKDNLVDQLEGSILYLNDLSELNKQILEKTEKVLVFYYNQAPKETNQLLKQIKSKLPHIHTVLMAKNLSDEKAKAHKSSEAGAQSYISWPTGLDKINAKLREL